MKTPFLLAGRLALLLATLVASSDAAPVFTDTSTAVLAVETPCVAWGDYDGDGDLDLLVAGKAPAGVSTVLYENTAGTFSDSGIALLGLEFASAEWGDFDNDGDLDLAMIGRDAGGIAATRVYRNDGGTSFVSAGGASLVDVVNGALAWGDYDNDGDLDLVVTGLSGSIPVTRLYRNAAGSFLPVSHPFPDVQSGTVAWGDYDGDGDLDLVIMGAGVAALTGGLFRNEDGSFVDAEADLPAVQLGFAAWGDHDSDGDLDLLLGGSSAAGPFTKVFTNDAGEFADAGAGLPALQFSAGAWGDYDNDGDLDIMLTGFSFSTLLRVSCLHKNDSGVFVDAGEAFPPVQSSATAWGDIDNDGDVDLVLAGEDAGQSYRLRIYRNGITVPNTAPSTPGNLGGVVEGSDVTLAWEAASDWETTTAAGLSYGLRVGTTPGGAEIVSPHALASGVRLVRSAGGTLQEPAASVRNLAPGTYYWSVQAIDSAFVGSPFATEASFTVLPARPEIVSIAREPGDLLRITWTGSPGSIYRIKVSPDLTPASWILVAMPTAGVDGLFEILVGVSSTSPFQRFYRAEWP